MNQSNALIHLPSGCLIDMLNTSDSTYRLDHSVCSRCQIIEVGRGGIKNLIGDRTKQGHGTYKFVCVFVNPKKDV